MQQDQRSEILRRPDSMAPSRYCTRWGQVATASFFLARFPRGAVFDHGCDTGSACACCWSRSATKRRSSSHVCASSGEISRSADSYRSSAFGSLAASSGRVVPRGRRLIFGSWLQSASLSRRRRAARRTTERSVVHEGTISPGRFGRVQRGVGPLDQRLRFLLAWIIASPPLTVTAIRCPLCSTATRAIASRTF